MPESTHAPLVSVSLITYNRAHLVTAALDSVLAQSYPNFEVIVVDDGSTDGTGRVVQERYGQRVRYIHQENRGPMVARNVSIREARGEYIALMDDDDLWLPAKLEKQIAALEAHPDCALAYCAAYEGDEEARNTGRLYGVSGKGRTGDCFTLYLRYTVILEPAVVMRKSVLDEVGLFDQTLPCGKDTDLFLRILMHYPAVYVPEPLLVVRQHAGRKTRTHMRTGEHLQAYIHALRKLLPDLPPARAGQRPLLIQQLLWGRLRLLVMQAHSMDWGAFTASLTGMLEDVGSPQSVHRVCDWVIEALIEWERTHRGDGALPNSIQVRALLDTIAGSAASRTRPEGMWRACLYAGLTTYRLGSLRMRDALGCSMTAVGSHPLVAPVHSVWTLMRGVGKALLAKRTGSSPT